MSSVITKLSSQARRKDLVNVFINEKYSFSAKLEDVLIQKIKVGQIISPSQISRLKKLKIDKNIYDLVIKYLSSRPHSQKEITDYLKKKGQSDKSIRTIVLKLTKQHYIDDLSFARWFVSSKQKSHKGGRMIESLLRQKGIDTVTSRQAISELISRQSELEVAILAVKKKAKNVSFPLDIKDKNKLLRFLISRGFNFETSLKAIDSVSKKD